MARAPTPIFQPGRHEGRVIRLTDRIAAVPINPIATLTARENVSVLAELTGHARDGRVDAVLGDVGLSDRADHFPAQLTAQVWGLST